MNKYDLLNPVYAWRSNVSCFCCPMQRKSDWQGLLKHHPELFAVAEEWERQSICMGDQFESKSQCTWNDDYSLCELRKWGGETLRDLQKRSLESKLMRYMG